MKFDHCNSTQLNSSNPCNRLSCNNRTALYIRTSGGESGKLGCPPQLGDPTPKACGDAWDSREQTLPGLVQSWALQQQVLHSFIWGRAMSTVGCSLRIDSVQVAVDFSMTSPPSEDSGLVLSIQLVPRVSSGWSLFVIIEYSAFGTCCPSTQPSFPASFCNSRSGCSIGCWDVRLLTCCTELSQGVSSLILHKNNVSNVKIIHYIPHKNITFGADWFDKVVFLLTLWIWAWL